jgi:two-component system, OmpR family, sensor histidine kinase VicK
MNDEDKAPGARSRVLDDPISISDQVIQLAETSKEISIVSAIGGFHLIYNNFFEVYKNVLHKYKRGEHKGIRWVSTIDKDSTNADLEVIKTFVDLGMQIKHVKTLPPMNFAVSNDMINATIDEMKGGEMVQSLLTSNDSNYVEHFYSIFLKLWSDGIDGGDRMRDVENGHYFADIEIIQDPRLGLKRARELVGSAKEEVLIIFATANAFRRQLKAGGFEILTRLAHNGVETRILMPPDSGNRINETINEIRGLYPQLEFRTLEEFLQINISIVVVDKKDCFVLEVRDDTEVDSESALGTSTYSNSRSIVLSYASIFDSLWKKSEMYEQLEIHDKMQKEFINIAAHELRTPIQPLLLSVESLRERMPDDEQVSIIKRNARRLQILVNNILDVTRMEAGLLRLEKDIVNLRDVILNVVKDLESQVSEQKLEIIYDNIDGNNSSSLREEQHDDDDDEKLKERKKKKKEKKGEKDILVEADKERLTQVICNLLSNAIKFTSNGTVYIQVEKENDKNKKEVIVNIKDTGLGVPPEISSRLFTKFATTSFEGTGLGLFIAKNIVEAHGGKIWYANNPDGIGATFSFSLPVRPQQRP